MMDKTFWARVIGNLNSMKRASKDKQTAWQSGPK